MEQSKAVVVSTKHVPAKIVEQFESYMPEIGQILPRDIPLEKFKAGLWLQFSLNSGLKDCTESSLKRAIVKAADKGLQPGRDCCILPFKNRKKGISDATLIEEYQGLVRRLDRTGRVEWVKAEPVYQRDHFICDELAERYEFQRHLGGDAGKLICYFSAIKLKGSQKPVVRVCTIAEVDKVKTTMGKDEYDTWVKWPEEMGRKTALKKQAKYMQLLDDDDDEYDPLPVTDDQAHKTIAAVWGDRATLKTGEVVEGEMVKDDDEPHDGGRDILVVRMGQIGKDRNYDSELVRQWVWAKYEKKVKDLDVQELIEVIGQMEEGDSSFYKTSSPPEPSSSPSGASTHHPAPGTRQYYDARIRRLCADARIDFDEHKAARALSLGVPWEALPVAQLDQIVDELRAVEAADDGPLFGGKAEAAVDAEMVEKE